MLGASQKTVKRIAGVNIDSGDRIYRIVAKRNSALAGTCACARNIERANGAVLSTHEAVINIARVHVISRDHPRRADVLGYGALPGACARARSVECGDGGLRVSKGRVAEIQEVICSCH
jgi:hypothetical protein